MIPQASDDRWYYAQGKTKIGPVPLAELRRLLAEGVLKPPDMILPEGAKRWWPLAEVMDILPETGPSEDPHWRSLAKDWPSSRGPISDPQRIQSAIKQDLLADATIEKHEFAFLLRLRRDTQSKDPQFDELFFKEIQRTLLRNGAISAEETVWLKELLLAPGMIDEREKQCLHELMVSADNHCQEFVAWCDSLGISKNAGTGTSHPSKKHHSQKLLKRLFHSAEGEKRWFRIAAGLSFVLLVSVAVGVYFIPRMWDGPRETNAADQNRGLDFAPAETNVPSASVKGNLYVVAVGVSKYRDSKYNLRFARADAEKLAEVFQKHSGSLFDEVIPTVLTEEKASRKEIFAELGRMKKKVNRNDMVIWTLAGHGANLDENKNFYFLPHDFDGSEATGVFWDDFTRYLGSLPCTVIVVLDTCHSGTVTKQVRNIGERKAALRRLQQRGMVVITACQSNETAQEKDEWGHGALTLALVEGLTGSYLYKGKAKTRLPAGREKSRDINLKDLDYYVTNRVQELAGDNQAVVTNHSGNIDLNRVFITSLK